MKLWSRSDKRMMRRTCGKAVVSICMALLLGITMSGNPINGMRYVNATSDDELTQSGTSTTTATTEAASSSNIDANGTLGKNSDVGIELSKSITGTAGKKVTIEFKIKSNNTDTIKIKSVYPVIDTMFPFETSGDAYKVVSAGTDEEKQKSLDAKYEMKARSDLADGYQSVRFIGEYTKTASDGTMSDYYVIKTINIYFSETDSTESSKKSSSSSGGSSSSSSGDTSDYSDDDSGSSYTSSYSGGSSSDSEVESTAPKLIIEGFDTTPKKVMAGDSFKMKIHVKNASKTTSVCNGKFLIGDEGGNFLPTSGSNAVFVEKIEADKTGDIEIELKTSADLAQKNYRLLVKGDFDDGKGNTYSASESVYLPVYQEVKLNVTDVTMTPESIGIGSTGTLVFTINNQGSAGIYNVTASAKDDAVTAQESYVGNIAANSSAYATLELTGAEDNTDKGTIKVVVAYEDSDGTKGELEQEVNCLVGVDAPTDDMEEFEDFDEEYEEGIPWWVWLIIGLVVVAAITVIVIILVKRRKKKLASLMEDDDDEDELGTFGDNTTSDNMDNEVSADDVDTNDGESTDFFKS